MSEQGKSVGVHKRSNAETRATIHTGEAISNTYKSMLEPSPRTWPPLSLPLLHHPECSAEEGVARLYRPWLQMVIDHLRYPAPINHMQCSDPDGHHRPPEDYGK